MFDDVAYAVFSARIQNILPVFKDGTTLKNSQKSIANIVEAARSCAPYLDELCGRWPNILERLDTDAPESIYKHILSNIRTDDFDTLCADLRRCKQQVHLLSALCDIAGVWNWADVTGVLSDFADLAMQKLIKQVATEMGFEGNERGPVPGLFVLALGKYGGCELNYSSDIDLIVFYDPEYIVLPQPEKAERILVRFVRKLMRGFDEITPDGYIFRTDLRLRPDPRANAVAVSTLTAERYYETLGQNWERAAMIKARFCGGDWQAADLFCETVLTPFIWRRSLDYAAIADIHSIKRQIQGGATIAQLQAAGHDIKLGLGGIREIEFYTQVQQLILGGRNTALRAPRTVDALEALAVGGYADVDTIASLQADYAALRDLEHRTQMYADAQTHIWPNDILHRLQLTALSGYSDLDGFEAEMTARFTRVHKHYTELFPGEEDLSAQKGSLVFTGVEAESTTLATLEAYGFTRGEMVWKTMAGWLGGRIRATRTQRARELLTRLAPRIVEACGETGAPDIAFFSFADFLSNLNAGVVLLSLLLGKPDTLISLIEMLAIAPRLAQTLSEQPALIDAMVEPEFLTQKLEIPKNQYSTHLSADTDFETSMNLVRQLAHEDQFNLTASVLRLQNVERVGQAYSAIAQAVIEALLPKAVQEVERVSGPLHGEFAIIGMGKLGSREMTLKSDVDLMLVYRDTEATPLGAFNKLARRFITSLSSVTEEGGLFEVDMALRPSGRSGPLAVSLEAFQSYYKDRAWTWEYMALSRARVISGSSDVFIKALTQHIESALVDKDYEGQLAGDILDMHARLARDKPARGGWDIKGVQGGLRDIEFIAQFLVLKHKPTGHKQGLVGMLEHAKNAQWLASDDAVFLLKTARVYQILLQVIAIAVDGILIPHEAPSSVKQLLAQSVGVTGFSDLEDAYKQWHETVNEIFARTIA
ncbi:MAG: bifunctional [glutamate--ammonia ligase]-adenylyl-L-tyrosine phosphorylase/[glutamate--ammonia-ligase] adenylyltransferase [Robiginitomaculum sp.]|nr:MAG: bifunctional [glutamate--ammonia ligase]-adenylyl-L-tyrosine phosphorylase/[glutamate--ammonia-ligase] adenylyltransferase [Robiginitomaculum sp.]